MPENPILPSRLVLWLIALAVAAMWFANLGSHRLFHPDEGRYGEIAREMAQGGDWVTPRLNGLKYFEKPPLQYWATAVAFRAFGVHEWTARLWPALAGLLAVAVIGIAGNALGGAALGAFAALVLAGTLYHAAIAQIVTLDSGLGCFLALAFAGIVIAQRPETTRGERRAWMWTTWAAMALAVLSKGLIGVVLPAGALVAYTAITRDVALWRRLHIVSGLAIFLAITAPWFVLVSRANPEFARFFFIHEHFERFLTHEHLRVGAWYYFIPLALVGILPWLAPLALGLPGAWRAGTPNALGFSWQRLALVYAGFVFVFFSASGSKLPTYILPIFAPLALVLGALLLELPARHLVRSAAVGAVGAGVLAIALFTGYDSWVAARGGGAEADQPAAILQAYGPWIKAAVAVAAAGQIMGWTQFRRIAVSPGARFLGVAALALSMLAAVSLGVAGYEAFSATRSTSAMLRAARSVAPIAPDAPFYQVEMYDQTAPFYLGRTTTLVAIRDELGPGIDAEPDRQIPTTESWIAQWDALGQGYAMMPPATFERLAANGVPMRVLARDGRRVTVSRR